jgi:hypothetical protein
MGAKVLVSPDGKRHVFHCVACDRPHVLDERWTFTGTVEMPTLEPSYKEWKEPRDKPHEVCHLLILSGRIHYCADCTHSWASAIVDMVDWAEKHPSWSWGE